MDENINNINNNSTASSNNDEDLHVTEILDQLSDFGLDDKSGDNWMDRLREAELPAQLGTIGPYELLEEISRGGQGIVYRAKQSGTGRMVAVKRLLAGSFATMAMRRRFEREVEVASALQHPNVVTVFAMEVVDGQPIFAMEWIEGIPVTDWAASDKSNMRDPAKIIELFIDICDAVGHAHQRGVIHRDLKPSNILVDKEGKPHILDFGLAKITTCISSEETMVTLPEQFVGTPAYASPEQIHGRIDVIDLRSDIYSLGVILYEMITGQRPYNVDGNWAEILHTIEHVEPDRPSSVCSQVDREVEAIILKSLSKDPDNRYQSVESLKEDLIRYTTGAPVLAHPPSSLYQLRKLYKQHRTTVITSILLLSILLVSAGVITALSIHSARKESKYSAEIEKQRDNLKTLYERAEIARTKAEHEAEIARDETHKAGQIHKFFDRMLTSVTPSAGFGPDVTLRQVLDEVSGHISEDLKGYPEAEAALRGTLGSTYYSLGKLDEAEMHLKIALDLRLKHYGEVHPRVSVSLTNLAGLYLAQGHMQEAEELLKRAIKIDEQVEPESIFSVTNRLNTLGETLRRQGRYDEAEVYFKRALDILLKDYDETEPEVIIAYNSLGVLYFSRADYAAALETLNYTLKLKREAFGDESFDVAWGLSNIAGVHLRLKEYDKAEPLIKEALRINKLLLEPGHPDIGKMTGNIAELLRQQGKYAEAEPMFHEAIEICKLSYDDDNPQISIQRYNLAKLELATNRAEEAEQRFRNVLTSQQNRSGYLNPSTINTLTDLVNILINAKRYGDAELLLQDYDTLITNKNSELPQQVNAVIQLYIDVYTAYSKSELADKYTAMLPPPPSSTPDN